MKYVWRGWGVSWGAYRRGGKDTNEVQIRFLGMNSLYPKQNTTQTLILFSSLQNPTDLGGSESPLEERRRHKCHNRLGQLESIDLKNGGEVEVLHLPQKALFRFLAAYLVTFSAATRMPLWRCRTSSFIGDPSVAITGMPLCRACEGRYSSSHRNPRETKHTTSSHAVLKTHLKKRQPKPLETARIQNAIRSARQLEKYILPDMYSDGV